MKKQQLLSSIFVISAMIIGSVSDAAYYDVQEIQGNNGSEIVISVQKGTQTSNSTVSVLQKNSAEETAAEVETAHPQIKSATKEDVMAKYQVKNRTVVQSQVKQESADIPVAPKREELHNTARVALSTTPVKKKTPKPEETYTKTEQSAQDIYEAKAEKNSNYYGSLSSEQALSDVEKVGNSLAANNDINLEIHYCIGLKQEVNAYTDGENNIVVFMGILPYIETEDELAFIIGHEMGHAVSKHVLKSTITQAAAHDINTIGKKNMKTKVTGVAASRIGNALGNAGFSSLGKLASGAIVQAGDKAVDMTTSAASNTFERGREKDADLLAIDYLVKTGYNPLAGISIMAKIGEVYPDLFVDHPSTDKRVVTMYNYVLQKYPQYISKGFGTSAYKTALAEYVKK